MQVFYVHHFYSKSLFYKLFNKVKNKKIFLSSNKGYVICEYNGSPIKVVFEPELNDNKDGVHILDFLSILSQLDIDPKLQNIECINTKNKDYSHRGRWGAKFGVNDVPILKWICEVLENRANWYIFLLRTEKTFIKYDRIFVSSVSDIETQVSRLKNHFIISDNFFINEYVSKKYLNHFFCLTNVVHQWNESLSIRWYYEFSNVFEKLNQPYDLCFSMRNHKSNRTNIINGLSELSNPKIYLSRVDNCVNTSYYRYDSLLKDDINLNLNITKGEDFEDLSHIENIEHYLDYLMRILPMAKMHILSESWDWLQGDLTSNYLSEKTYGFLLAKIPFISTHPYPLEIVQKMLKVDPHPFYSEIKKIKGNSDEFVKFVRIFMENFEGNYSLCKEWVENCHNKLMEEINNKNSFLELYLNGDIKVRLEEDEAVKKLL
jgi:hypothetical protein